MDNLEDIQLKKMFLIVLIISLSIAALIGIIFFLIGSFNKYAIKVILTTLVLGGYSIIGMSSAELFEKRKWKILPLTGIVVYLFGLITAVLYLWEVGTGPFWKAPLIFLVISVTIAQMSLLYLMESKKDYVNIGLASTSVFASLVALALIALIIEPNIAKKVGEFYFRLLGVFVILDGLGTIITPIMYQVSQSK